MLPRVDDVHGFVRPQALRHRLRVLVTGVRDAHGVALCRSIGDCGAKLAIQADHVDGPLSDLIDELEQRDQLAGANIGAIHEAGPAMCLTAEAAKVQGSLDLVVNFVDISAETVLAGLSDGAALDDVLWDELSAALSISQVAANRMGLMWSRGLVVNVLRVNGEAAAQQMLIGALSRAGLAAATRGLAQAWAEAGVRINAIADEGEGDDGNGLLTILFDLIDGAGRDLSGCVFEAGLAPSHC